MKAPRKPAKVKISNLLEKSLAGAEPMFKPNEVAERDALADAYNWYNTNYDYSDSRRFLVAYLKSVGHDKDALDNVSNLPLTYHATTVGWVARILTRGAILPDVSREWFDQQIQKILAQKPIVVVNDAPAKATIQDRMNAQYDRCLADLEEKLDLFFDDQIESFDVKAFLSEYKLSAPVAKRVQDHYKPLMEEYDEVLARKDEQLNEAYSSIPRAKVKAMKAFLDAIIVELGNETYKAKMVRKPRRARVVPATKQVAKMKYMMHCADPELHSVAPEGIIGASQLWVYNVKKRKLGVYNSESAGGLRVKGSSILAFDPKTSVAKKLRKPEKVLATVTQGGKVALRSVLDDVRAVASELNGRINADTILVRVVK